MRMDSRTGQLDRKWAPPDKPMKQCSDEEEDEDEADGAYDEEDEDEADGA